MDKKRKRIFKQIISIFLVFVMVLTLVPGSVLSAEENPVTEEKQQVGTEAGTTEENVNDSENLQGDNEAVDLDEDLNPEGTINPDETLNPEGNINSDGNINQDDAVNPETAINPIAEGDAGNEPDNSGDDVPENDVRDDGDNSLIISVFYAGTPDGKFTYEVKDAADAYYIGEYIIYSSEDEKVASGKLSEKDKGQITFDVNNLGEELKTKTPFQIVLKSAVKGVTYTVNELAKANMAAEEPKINTATAGLTDNEVEYSYREATAEPVVLSKKWNDAGKPHTDDEKEEYLNNNVFLKFSVDGGATWISFEDDEEAALNALGISELPEMKAEYDESTWKYSFAGLPLKNTNGAEIKYGFSEKDVDGYIQSVDADNPTNITNTTEYTFEANVSWNDNSNKYNTRPDLEGYAEGIKLYRYTNSKDLAEEVSDYVIADNLSITENGNTWTISMDELPMYDENGNLYTYYVAQDTGFAGENGDDIWEYTSKYENVDANGFFTDELYENGSALNTLTYKTDFKFEVEWIDGGNEEYRDNTMYLFRYAEGEGSVETASPVQGFDKVFFEDGKLYYKDKNDNKVEITADENGVYTYVGAAGKTELDKYSPTGTKYVYFIKQKDLGNADYQTTIFDENGTEGGKILLSDGKILNQLGGETTQSVTKTWDAKVMQGFGPSTKSLVELQMRYIGKSNDGTQIESSWQDVKETEVTGFSSEIMTKSEDFGSYPKYTDEDVTVDNTEFPAGSKIEYRVVEKGITVENAQNPNNVVIKSGNFEDGSDIIVLAGVGPDGTDAVFIKTEDYDTNTIVNRIVTKTQVKVDKKWNDNGDESWPEGVTVEATVKREDGKAIIDINGDTVENPVLILSAENPTLILDNIPRFDTDTGREISYYVTEVVRDAQGNDITSNYYRDVSYKKVNAVAEVVGIQNVGIKETDAHLYNFITTEGNGMNFRISKEWLDDGDLLSREAVTVGVYKKTDIISGDAFNEDGTLKADEQYRYAEKVLNDSNVWTDKVYFEGEGNRDDYIALEVMLGSSPVKYISKDDSYAWIAASNSSYNQIKAETAEKLGTVTGSSYYYNTYLAQTVTLGEPGYAIYNQRYGNISIELNKKWNIGNTTLNGANFQIKCNGKVLSFDNATNDGEGEVKVADEDTEKVATEVRLNFGKEISCVNLPKYDSIGRLLTYTLEEKSIIDGEGKVWPISNGVAKILFENDQYDQYSSSVGQDEAETVIMGTEEHHSGDKYVWTATNSKSQKFNVSIRKIWQDDGTESDCNVRRPDIYFRMYRVSTKNAEYSSYNKLMALSKAEVAALCSNSQLVQQVGQDYLWDTQHNDWYWTCDTQDSFERYDSEGYEYLYFAVETCKNPEEYATYYYNGTTKPNDKVNGAEPEDTTEVFDPTDYNANIGANLLIVHKEGDGLQASGSIINTRIGNFKADGKKLWDNLPKGFDTNNLPDVEMQILRKLKTDESQDESGWTVINDENGNSSITVHSTSASNSFSFGYLPRYDEYGRTYQYKTKELTEIEGYKSQQIQGQNAFVWVNTYDKTAEVKQKVEIGVEKTWIFPSTAVVLPKQTFELWREVDVKVEGALASPEKVATIELSCDDLNNAVPLTEDSYFNTISKKALFTKTGTNNDGDELPYYAPNGYPYKYYVKEIVPAGYYGTLANGIDNDGNIVTGVQGDGKNTSVIQSQEIELQYEESAQIGEEEFQTVYSNVNTENPTDTDTSYTNRFNGKPERKVDTATKTWKDQSNAYDTRPTNIVLTLKRTDNSSKDAANDETVAVSTNSDECTWTKDGDTWKCTFINKNYASNPNGANTASDMWDTYSPAGKKYTYYVVESALTGEEDKFDSYAHKTISDFSFENTIDTTSINVKKVWKGTDGTSTWIYTKDSKDADHNDTELENLCKLGAIPKSITFTLRYSNDGTTWNDVKKNGEVLSYTYDLTTNGVVDIVKVKAIRDTGYTFTDVPKYALGNNGSADKSTLMQYQIKESFSDAPDVTATKATSDEEITADNTSCTVENTITLKEQVLTKVWVDNNNRDNTRPDKVTFKVTQNGNDVTYVLQRVISDDEDINKWTKSIWVPTANMTVAEPTVPTGYEIVTKAAGDDTNTITNKLIDSDRKVITLDVNKKWSDSSYSSMYEEIRPESITYKLQYKYFDAAANADTEWKDADSDCGVDGTVLEKEITVTPDDKTVTDTADTNVWGASWDGLYQYYDNADTAVPEPIKYRVLEQTVTGYTTAYEFDATSVTTAKDGIEATKGVNGKSKITVTNTIDDSTKLTLQKKWADDAVIKTALSKAAVDTTANKGAVLTTGNIKLLQDQGILPKQMRFELQYSDDNGASWKSTNPKTYKDYGTNNDSVAAFSKLLSGDVAYAKLPKVDADGNSLQYRLKETGVMFNNDTAWRDVTDTSTNTMYEVAMEENVTTSSQKTIVTNTVPSAKITVTKDVIDEDNRDNKRGNVEFTLKRNGNTYATGTLTYDKALKTWSTCDFVVPVYAAENYTSDNDEASKNVWTVAETKFAGNNALNGYTATYVYDDDAAAVNIVTSKDSEQTAEIINTYVPVRFDVSAKKKWNDTENAMNSRPEDSIVEFTLQYSLDNGASWQDVSKAEKTADTSKPYYNETDSYYSEYDNTSNEWQVNGTKAYTLSEPTQEADGLAENEKTATWNNLPIYSQGEKIIYRVIENGVSGETSVKGYKVLTADMISVSGTKISKVDGIVGGFTANDTGNAGSPDITVNNIIDTTTLDLEKTWVGDAVNIYTKSMRPASVMYKVEYSIDGTNWYELPDNISEQVEDGKCTVTCTTPDKGNVDTKTITGLPKMNAAGTVYLYRVSEVKFTFADAKTAELTPEISWSLEDAKNSVMVTDPEMTIGAYNNTSCKTVLNDDGTWKTEITNELPTTNVSATKVWRDGNDRDNKRADMTFKLAPYVDINSTETLSNDFVPEFMTLKPTDNPLKVTWESVPEYRKDASAHNDANKYIYKVTETQLTDYQAPVVIDDSNIEKTVINIHDIDTFKLTANKVWDTSKNDNWYADKTLDEIRENITLTLQYKTESGTWLNVNEAAVVEADKLPTEKGADVILFIYKATETSVAKDRIENGYYKWNADNSCYEIDVDGVYVPKPEQKLTSENGKDYVVWENVPIYRNKGQVITYRVIENGNVYYFSKPSEDVTGVDKDNKDKTEASTTITNKPLSIKLIKYKNDGKTTLKNITFKMWDKNNPDKVIEAKTDENGELIFTGLEKEGTYVIQEVNTGQGLQLLCESFEVTVPMNMTDEEVTEKNANTANAVDNEDGTWSFYQLTYKVTNTANFVVPMTGRGGTWYPGLIALIVMAGIAMIYFNKRKNNKCIGGMKK